MGPFQLNKIVTSCATAAVIPVAAVAPAYTADAGPHTQPHTRIRQQQRRLAVDLVPMGRTMKPAIAVTIAALSICLAACSTSSEPVAVADPTVSMPTDATDQAGIACVAALAPKVGEKTPMIRNHTTQAVADTFVTTGQVSNM